jgi:hypothetical protein
VVRQLKEILEASTYDRPFENDPDIAPILERVLDPWNLRPGQLVVDCDGDEGYVEMVEMERRVGNNMYTITVNYGRSSVVIENDRYQWVMWGNLTPEQNPDLYTYRPAPIQEII